MKKIFFAGIVMLLCVFSSHAQHTIRLAIRNEDNQQPLAGATATIVSLRKTTIADSTGMALFQNIPAGNYTISISFTGLKEKEIRLQVPQNDSALEVLLEATGEHEEEVIVTATRISRSIANIPTRVEVISGEELAEKGNMKPGDIRMMLNESTGIQTQQTSATSFNAGIRIQGLDGRYTQIAAGWLPAVCRFFRRSLPPANTHRWI